MAFRRQTLFRADFGNGRSRNNASERPLSSPRHLLTKRAEPRHTAPLLQVLACVAQSTTERERVLGEEKRPWEIHRTTRFNTVLRTIRNEPFPHTPIAHIPGPKTAIDLSKKAPENKHTDWSVYPFSTSFFTP